MSDAPAQRNAELTFPAEREGVTPFGIRQVLIDLEIGIVIQGPKTEILLANPAARELLGLDEAQLLGLTSYDPSWRIVREDGSIFPANERPVQSVLSSRRAVRGVVMGIDRPAKGDRVWLLVNAVPELDERGDVAYVVATLDDITERRRLEASLVEARKLESLGRLAGGIAHDFNNLLTIIQSCTALAAQHVPAGSSARADLDEAFAASQRAAALTRELLTFARQQPVAARDVDINQVIEASERMVRRLIGELIELRVVRAPAPLRVHADGGQLERAIINLCVNARDAMPSGGVLTVRCDEVIAPTVDGVTLSGRWAQLSVADTGVGMDEITRARLFEPFFTTKPPHQGTGLGLAIVHGVVETAGGRLAVESALGRGSTFTIWLPIVEPKESAPGTDTEQNQLGGVESILVVEDQAPVRALTARMLQSLGYQVQTAVDGVDALETLSRAPDDFRLVLSDVVMPRMDGLTLLREIRARWPKLAVILVSGNADGVESGVSVLPKPYDVATLATHVRQAIDRR